MKPKSVKEMRETVCPRCWKRDACQHFLPLEHACDVYQFALEREIDDRLKREEERERK